MDKNNDALTFDHHNLLTQATKDPFLKELFKPIPGEPVPKKGKMSSVSLGAKFIVALDNLMAKLNSTRANFVR